MPQTQIILASSSPYRKQLLERLHIYAQCIAPDIDEQAFANESPHALALRLAISKAGAVVTVTNPKSIIIGSDQVAIVNGEILGKPHTAVQAVLQLQKQSGQRVIFYTALCVQQGDNILSAVATTEVVFRTLSTQEIKTYIALEQPLDCAGSFKCEGLGITLFEKIISDDPSALIGLPLIKTAQFLRELGVNPLLQNQPKN
ncbi:MAG: nucleoside triphosphate pyrophosphatase [Marinagarivorans sp.]|nr:nucleoside triphosphate pyrophosphatase [Marinagarivorans sp.]